MLGNLASVLLPVIVGVLLERRILAVATSILLGSIVFWWPQDTDAGDDWRPLMYPAALLWLIVMTVIGTAIRRRALDRR